MRTIFWLMVFQGFLLCACKNSQARLETRAVEKNGMKCIVQQLPEDYGNPAADNKFDYYRIIIESKARLRDSSDVNYVNFGIENSIRKVAAGDTLYPAFAQRIANGRKDNYEYIVSFQKEKNKIFEIIIDDQVFEMGLITVKF